MNTYFITENYIKQNSPVTQNVDPKDLYPHIEAAEKLTLQYKLGSSFYEYLKDAFDNQTLTPEEAQLVQLYIKPAVLWRTLHYALPWIHYNLRNKGFIQNTDDNGVSADSGSVKYMINEASNRAEYYETQLVKYLKKNASTFPGYTNQDGLNKPQKGNSWDYGIVMH